jgi:hypothetical protein
LDEGDNGDQGMQGDGNGQGDDNNDQGHDTNMDDDHDARDGTVVSISFANKTDVVINGGNANNFFLTTVNTPADGLRTLTLNGNPSGTNILAGRPFPSSVKLTLNNIQVKVSDIDDVMIEELYEERLGRGAALFEVQEWAQILQTSGLQAVVAGIEGSLEARTHIVQSWYHQFLGRDAVNGEEQGWVNLLLRGEAEEQVLAGILSSGEFYARAQTLISSGTADQRWIAAMYQVLLGRMASSAEISDWTTILTSSDRQTVSLAFLESAEFRIDTITAFYANLLGRAPDAPGLNAWVMSGIDMEHVREGFEASAEFVNDA